METGSFSHKDSPRIASSDASVAREALLLTGTSREVLARIVPGDPLGLAAIVGARLRTDALLCDADAVLLRAFAACARSASEWRGRPALDVWLGARVDEALHDVLHEEATRDSVPGNQAESASGAFDVLAPPLGLEPSRMRAACTRFNRLAASARQAFFGLVLERASLDEVASRLGLGLSETARCARAALHVFASPPPESPPL